MTDRASYVRSLLALYCGLPHTAPRRPSSSDRQLAHHLFDRAAPLDTLDAAFSLAIARRNARSPQLPPLPPIRSLAYFLPLLEELLLDPPDPGYLHYLRCRAYGVGHIPTDPGER